MSRWRDGARGPGAGGPGAGGSATWRSTVLTFLLGLAAAAAAIAWSGADAVVRALGSLHFAGLAIIVLLHLPVVALMGLAWRRVCGEPAPASRARFLWARFVRDAGAEVLPFSQLGGFALALRALGRGRPAMTRGAVSMSVDLVIELAAKLPYVLAGLIVLLALAPRSGLVRSLSIALVATLAVVAIPLLARGRVGPALRWMARAVSRRWPALGSRDGTAFPNDAQADFDRILADRARLSSSFALHVLCWALGAGEAWVMLHLLGTQVTAPQALAIDSTVAALRTFGFMIPAAAGVQEASYLLGAGVFGIPPALAIAASLARRARDLVLGGATLSIAGPSLIRKDS